MAGAMSSTIEIILSIIDGTGAAVTEGSAVFTATSPVISADGTTEIIPAPVTIQLDDGPPPVSATLLPTDVAGDLPIGWAWQVSFPDVPGDLESFTFAAPAGPASFAAAAGTPGVITWTATAALTALPNGTGVKLTGGSLPTGITAGTTYFVVGTSGQTIQLAATSGGSPLTLTSSGSGQLTVVSYYLASVTRVTTGAALTPLASYFDELGAAAAAQAAAEAASMPTLAQVAVSTAGTLAVNKVTTVTAAAALTMTLPTPVTGDWVVCERATASAASVTVTGLIRGVANTSVTLQLDSESEMFFATGGSWWPIAGHKTLGSLDNRYLTAINVKGTPYGAKGDGTTDDTAAIQAAIKAAQPGQVVYLPAGNYLVSAPINLTNGVTLLGPNRSQQGAGSDADYGAVLVPSLTFPGQGTYPISAVIQGFGSSVTGLPSGTPVISTYVRIINIAVSRISGRTLANAVDGIAMYGNVNAGLISGCFVFGMNNNIALYNDATDSVGPDGWQLEDIVCANAVAYDFNLNCGDMTCFNCHVQEDGGSNTGGWLVYGASGNTRMIGCRSDDNGGPGFTLVGPSGSAGGGYSSGYSDSLAMIGCGAQNNGAQDVLILDSYTGTGSPAPSNVIIDGCSFDMGGRVGGSGTNYASIEVNGLAICKIANTNILVDTNGNAAGSPQYAIATSASANGGRVPLSVRVEGGFISASVAIINNAAPATDLYISPRTIAYVGQHAGHIAAANITHVPDPLSILLAPAGALAETYPRVQSITGGGGSMTSGTVYLRAIPLVAGTLISDITFWTAGSVKTGGVHGWYVLCDSTRKVLAVTADQTDAATVWGTANTPYPLPLTSPYTIQTTGLYYIGFMVAETSGSMPTFVVGASLAQAGMQVAPVLFGNSSSTAQTTPPAVGSTLGGISPNGNYNFYGYVS
jgi:hypothetical protein